MAPVRGRHGTRGGEFTEPNATRRVSRKKTVPSPCFSECKKPQQGSRTELPTATTGKQPNSSTLGSAVGESRWKAINMSVMPRSARDPGDVGFWSWA